MPLNYLIHGGTGVEGRPDVQGIKHGALARAVWPDQYHQGSQVFEFPFANSAETLNLD